MRFYADPADTLPIYRQLMRQVNEGLAAGRLAPGEQLPSHRHLSLQLTIAPLTVKRAYDELEKLGLVTQTRGLGSFIADPLPDPSAGPPPPLDGPSLREAARDLLRQAARSGLDLTDVIALLADASRQLATQETHP